MSRPGAAGRTVGALWADAARRLAPVAEGAGRLEARILLGHVMAKPGEWMLAHPEALVPQVERRRLAGLLRRRIVRRMPLAYLTGRREFAGLEFHVRPGVLIPRPETEGLLERVEGWLANRRAAGRAGAVVDLGTGSGALAVALAKRSGVRVLATDRSAVAVRVARMNAARHGMAGIVTVLRGSWMAPIERLRLRPSPVVVMSNPPYVSTRLMRRLQPEVRREPRLALAAGADGLDSIRRVITGACALAPGGLLAMEIGAEQGGAVRRLLGSGGWRGIRIDRDLAGRDRYALAERAG